MQMFDVQTNVGVSDMEEMPGSRMSSMHRQQIGEKPDWKTAEEWAKIHDAMSPEEHRELQARQRDLHGPTSEDQYRQEVRNREQKPTYGRIACGGAFPRAAIPMCSLCGQPKSCHVPEGHAFDPDPRIFPNTQVFEWKEKDGVPYPQVREAVSWASTHEELRAAGYTDWNSKDQEAAYSSSEYDRIRSVPTSIEPDWIGGTMGVHEMGFRAWHILEKVKALLSKGVPGEVVRELIEHMESKP